MLATEHVRPACTVRASQRLDILIEASDLSRTLDVCSTAGGRVPVVRIYRMGKAFGGIPAGAPYLRCYGVAH